MATIKIKKAVTPIGGEEEDINTRPKGRSSVDKSVYVRDLITGLVGGGYTSLQEDNARKNFLALKGLVGPQRANEILTKVMIHNQDPRYKALPVEERITSFYDQQKQNPIVGEAGRLGYGVLPGFRSSPNVLLQSLQGGAPASGTVQEPGFSKSMMLKVSK